MNTQKFLICITNKANIFIVSAVRNLALIHRNIPKNKKMRSTDINRKLLKTVKSVHIVERCFLVSDYRDLTKWLIITVSKHTVQSIKTL